MPGEALNDLALAVLRYDQGVRQYQRERERHLEAKGPVEIRSVPDLEELYEEMMGLARFALKAHPLPRGLQRRFS